MNQAIKKLQDKIGVNPDGDFGPNTARAIASHYELSPVRAAHLLGQACHESGGFKYTRESLSYSKPERIKAVWPSRFPTIESAAPYIKNPHALAGKVYSGRMGNKTKEQAAKFTGRGFLQLTGYDNYQQFAFDMHLPEVITDPDLVATDYAFETALWFFDKNGLFTIADEGVTDETIKRITKRVNGGYHGLEDRITQTNKIHAWIVAT